jgi:hypothetical protein
MPVPARCVGEHKNKLLLQGGTDAATCALGTNPQGARHKFKSQGAQQVGAARLEAEKPTSEGSAMSRHARRASAAKARHDRVAHFREQSAGGGFETSLRAVGEHRPQDRIAIGNWLLREPSAHPTCFSCRGQFSPTRRPAGFLTAVASRAPGAGVAVSGICAGAARRPTRSRRLRSR